MESIANIHSNEHNDPKLMGKIAEANLTKHAIQQKIQELKQERNAKRKGTLHARSLSQFDQAQTAGYGTLGYVDGANNPETDPRDSSRIPRREELTDLKQFIPSSPGGQATEDVRLHTRYDASSRLSTQPVYRSTRVSDTFNNLGY
jgi:hypothetical protein